MTDLKFLVVDDSSVQCQHAAALCRESGAESVHSAADGEQALQLLRNQQVDVVLVDLEMPVMDGVELIGHIGAEQLAVAVIILSAKDSSLIASVGTMAEASGLMVLGTIKKPVTAQLLALSLQQLQNRQQVAVDSGDNSYHSTSSELAKAITEKHFQLYYQPKLTSSGLLLKGVEALARWPHSQRGFIPPTYFIEDAESYGLIGVLTFHLLESALQQKCQWQKYGFNFNLAFNLSPMSLANNDFADWISDFVASYGIAPADITFEVTENILLGDVAKSIQTLARLRLRGFAIAIDDYGTGFANAEQLSRIPATELKLDRSMVDGASAKPQQQKILDSTVKLARELGLSTVAEGVEQQSDYQLVADLGVDLIQGYLFSKPLEADKLPGWAGKELKELRKQH